MTEILFVCTGNQFRSPLAAAYFTAKLRQSAATSDWIVLSAGTWTAARLPAHPIVQAEAAKLGLDLSAHLSCEVDQTLLRQADLIVVMENGHKEAIEFEFPDCRGRIALLSEAAGEKFAEIPDPARSNFVGGEAIARSIVSCIDKGFSTLIKMAEVNHATRNHSQ